MKLSRDQADFYIPDQAPEEHALAPVTHLGIGAHQDDLEFMALHGILACYRKEDQWFGGLNCTDGAGSARSGDYAGYTDAQVMAERVKEQRTAVEIGQYAFMAQLGYVSREVKEPPFAKTVLCTPTPQGGGD